MATVTGFTALRMAAIEAMSVVSGVVQDGKLILTRRDGTTIDAGNVRGPQGIQGPVGTIQASPAGGDLSGSYPAPTIADNVITGAKIVAALKDAAANVASLRTLGTGAAQAAAGNHNHGDTGWVNFTPVGGDAPFGSATATVGRAQYRRFGPMVHVRIQKDVGSAGVDRTTSTGGNFTNVAVMGANSIPAVARPDQTVVASGRLADSPNMFYLSTDGAIYWVGGFPRNYPAGSSAQVDFFFMTTAAA